MKNKINRRNTTIIGVLFATCVLLIARGVLFSGNKDNGPETVNGDQKGTLVINTDKTQYQTGEQVNIQLTHLDNQGNALCKDNLQLEIISNNEIVEQPEVTLSPTCGQKNSYNPDYTAFYVPEENGKYLIRLTSSDNKSLAETVIDVGENTSLFTISRWGASKVKFQDNTRYPMVIKATANSDFSGKISDTLPQGFKFAWYGNAQINENNITWDINLKAKDTIELKYEYIPNGDQLKNIIGPITIFSNGETQEIGNEWNLVIQNI